MGYELKNWNVAAKLNSIAADRGLGQYGADRLAAGMDPYVPFEHGDLSGSVTTQPFKVFYPTVYARYQWYGVGFDHTRAQHPLAMAKWVEGFKSAKMDWFTDELQRYIREM